MGKKGINYLMYHELQLPGRQTISNQPGYLRYVVHEADFRRQLSHLRLTDFRGMNVSQALNDESGVAAAVAITFDDGCETDLTAAAPYLKEMCFQATFYLVAGHLGRKGNLSHSQVRELCELGFEIGCHSMTHSFLTDLDERRLHTEIAEAKDRIEQVIGRRVDHFSCPGGRWDHRVVREARESGYRSVATSRAKANSRYSDPYRLGRLAILRETKLAQYERLCRGEGMFKLRAQQAVLAAAKTIVGNRNYDEMRTKLMK